MNTVNELKRLLQLDVEKIRSSLLENASTLESLNRQSEKLNQLVLSGDDTDDFEIIFEGSKEAKGSSHHRQEMLLKISPGVDGTRVKTFEELVNLKLQQGERAEQQQQQQQQMRQKGYPFKAQISTEKRPFLKRGEGLRRFSKEGAVTSPKDGNTESTTKSLERPQVTPTPVIKTSKSNDKSKNSEVITESLAGKEQPLLRKKDPTEKKCIKKRTDFFRKVLPISQITQNMGNSTMVENGTNSTNALHFQAETRPDSFSTVKIVRQIGYLEKRLFDLMTLKGQLTEERMIFDSRETSTNLATSEHLASSIELIRKEIAALNSKVFSLTMTTTTRKSGSVEEEKEDKNSRHLEATEDASREASASESATTTASCCISTLSNGDKIAFAKDQSITYMHGNGTSQTLYRDGLKVIRFPNGQIEKLHPDGSKEITYADDGHQDRQQQQQQQQRRLMIKRRTADGSEEIILSNGTVHSTTTDGNYERTLYPNGDVEWRTKEYTRRHFNAGHIKTQYANGCSETIFSSGRVRLKDAQGNVLFDRRP